MKLFQDIVGPDFIFMDDNAKPNRVVIDDDFLEEVIHRKNWPSK